MEKNQMLEKGNVNFCKTQNKKFDRIDRISSHHTTLCVTVLLFALVLQSPIFCAEDTLTKSKDIVDGVLFHPAIKAIVLTFSAGAGIIHGFFKGGGLTAFLSWFGTGVIFSILKNIVGFLAGLGA